MVCPWRMYYVALLVAVGLAAAVKVKQASVAPAPEKGGAGGAGDWGDAEEEKEPAKLSAPRKALVVVAVVALHAEVFTGFALCRMLGVAAGLLAAESGGEGSSDAGIEGALDANA